jgi:riboflavin biosynthesis pyrimidine reductase
MRLTLLGSVDSADEARLTDLYDYPDAPQACWVRGNMITSLDGGATDEGSSGGLGGAGDRVVFKLMRQAADVILVGASTVRVESYSGVQLSPAQRQERQRRGQAEVPPIAILTNSGDIDRDAKVFSRTEVPPLIFTSDRAAPDVAARLGAVAEVIAASGPRDDQVDPAVLLQILADRKLVRVLCEGGPHILGLLIEKDLLDELCLTIAPVLVGGAAGRIAAGAGHAHTGLRRTHLLTDDDGYLYTRYVRGS